MLLSNLLTFVDHCQKNKTVQGKKCLLVSVVLGRNVITMFSPCFVADSCFRFFFLFKWLKINNI